MNLSDKHDLGFVDGGTPQEPLSSTILRYRPTPLQKRILNLAGEMMDNRYLLDSELLYSRCVRFFKDVEVQAINSALNGLLDNKILVDGKAVTKLNLLENDNRDKTLDLIKKRPGLNITKIADMLKISVTTVKWHVKMLEKFEFIRGLDVDETKTYYFDFYLKKGFDKIFIAMNKKNMHVIVKNIWKNQGIGFVDLLELLDIPRTTLMRKVKELIELGIVRAAMESNQITALSLSNVITNLFQQFHFID